MEIVILDGDSVAYERERPNSSSHGCDTCRQLLYVIRGNIGDEIVLTNASHILHAGVCETHEKFFQGILDAHGPRRVSFASPPEAKSKYPTESFLIITKGEGERLWLKSSDDFALNGELFVASSGGYIPVEGETRLIDRLWIDPHMIKSWKTSCSLDHGIECSEMTQTHFPRPRHLLLIDAVDNCIVDDKNCRYVALSYVWGQASVLKTTTQNLANFRHIGSLAQLDCSLPQTVKDAMTLVKLLGERYLWVDAICIVQDDPHIRDHLIHNMGAVFANAVLTIVAADGSDADSGIKGFKELSGPRDNVCVHQLTDGIVLNSPPVSGLIDSVWNERGWTFQEYLLSPKRLIFIADSVRWECPSACFWEELRAHGVMPTKVPLAGTEYDPDDFGIRRAAMWATLKFPDLEAFGKIVNSFNERHFTYANDVISALSGLLTVLSPKFIGGFLWAVPVMFLDLGLLWTAPSVWIDERPEEPRRRWDPQQANHDGHAPSWSWASIKGTIVTRSIWRNEDWLLYSRGEWFYGVDPIRRVIPLVDWTVRSSKTQETALAIPYANEWYTSKLLYAGAEPPNAISGWSRRRLRSNSSTPDSPTSTGTELAIRPRTCRDSDSEHKDTNQYPPEYYYTHASMEGSRFLYPVPLPESPEVGRSLHLANSKRGRYLCGSTNHGYFSLKPTIGTRGKCSCEVYDAGRETRIGRFWPDEPFADTQWFQVELVAISLKYAADNGHRFEQPYGREAAQFYNVLWVEWIDGVAYRKGLGEVERHGWESQQLEPVELILG